MEFILYFKGSCKSLHHSPAIPLGLKQEDYILKGLSLQEEIDEREEEEEEEEESEEEEEEEEEEAPDQMNDYYEGDSDIMEGNMTPPPEVQPLHLGDMT
uniref:Uncharacterized protein n=1 Tax=Amphimedon queenslandica TaxID=400682 RepID=A0A1X7SZ86_AMPQE